MYANLTPTLIVLVSLVGAVVAFVAIRRPFLGRLAVRQVGRRRREAALVVAGSMLGTAIIVGSLIVGDTLNFSVKQTAYENLGPIDETVTSSSLVPGRIAAQRLRALRDDPQVDGLLTVRGDVAAVTMGSGGRRVAEPQVGVWDLDLADAAAFGGGVEGGSGLTGPAPLPGEVVINAELADGLAAAAGDELTFYLYGRPVAVTVARVVPMWGVAGMPIDGITRAAFFPPDTLERAAAAGGATTEPRTFTFVSNVGGVESGDQASDAVTRKIDAALGSLTSAGTSVAESKQRVLADARQTGDGLGFMFLMIGSFAIIAGVLLLVNIFVMLAEERKPELGMLRAVGMKRSRVVRSFIVEGTIYAFAAALLGTLVGIGVGRAVVVVAARIYQSFQEYEALRIVFHVTPISLVNGFAIGFLIGVATVAFTSVRISRINIIAAIRDLPPQEGRRMKRRWVVVSTVLAAVSAAASVPVIAAGRGVGVYVVPALAVVFSVPLLLRSAPKRWVYSGAAIAVLGWTLAANTVRPRLMDDVASSMFIMIGVLLTFSAVVLVSQNQETVTAPLRPLIDRPTQRGLSTRLAIAYPLGRRFRTGALLSMYALVVFTLVFITTLSALVQGTVSRSIASAGGGFTLRADFNPATPIADPARAFGSGELAGQVRAYAPLLGARATVTDLAAELTAPVDAVVVGFDDRMLASGGFPLTKRDPTFATDEAAWRAVLTDRRYAIVDNFLGQLDAGGPPRELLRAGGTFTLTDPLTGRREEKVIAGTLDSSYGFYGMGGGLFSPVLVDDQVARAQFGPHLQPTSVLIEPAPGVSDQALVARLQGRFLPEGLVATSIEQVVERNYAASRGFFELMQGFVALGLLVGIAGLGVVMVRAVRERRRSIGVLRALGFPSATVQRAFLIESLFVTVEGVVLGTVLSLVTTYMLFKNYELFRTAGGGFSIPWLAITALVVAATVASVLATVWPARQASRIRPAVALRLAD